MRYALPLGVLSLTIISGLMAQEPPVTPAVAGSIPSSFRSFIVVDNRTERYLIPKDKEFDPVKVLPHIPKLLSEVAKDRSDAETELEKIIKSKDKILTLKLESKLNPKNRAGKIHSVIEDQNLYPTLAVFVKSTPDPASKLTDLINKTKGLMAIEKYKAMNFGAFVIFVNLTKEFQDDEKRDEAKKAIEDWADIAGKPNVKDDTLPGRVGLGGVLIGLAGKESEAAKNWKLGDDDITIVLYHRLKEVQRWKFKDADFKDTDVDAIIDATKKEMDKR